MGVPKRNRREVDNACAVPTTARCLCSTQFVSAVCGPYVPTGFAPPAVITRAPGHYRDCREWPEVPCRGAIFAAPGLPMRIAVDSWVATTAAGRNRRREASPAAVPTITSLYLVGNQSEIHAALPNAVFVTTACAWSTPASLNDGRQTRRGPPEKEGLLDRPRHGFGPRRESDAVVSLGNTGGIFARRPSSSAGSGRGSWRYRDGHSHPDNELSCSIPGQYRVQTSALGALCRHGQHLFPEILGYQNPRVGILSIGTEDSKGNELTLEAFKLCKQLELNFIGNIEGHDLFRNHVDVVVCDGSLACGPEDMREPRYGHVSSETRMTANLAGSLAPWLARNAFRSIKRAHG